MRITGGKNPPVAFSLRRTFGLLIGLVVLVGAEAVVSALRDRAALIVGAATGVLLGLPVATALTATIRTTRAITRPLADIEAVLGRLARAQLVRRRMGACETTR